MAKEGAEEDESEREGDPDQVLQRQAGLHLGVGPLVGCGDNAPGPACLAGALPPPHAARGLSARSTHAGGWGAVPSDLVRWCYSRLARAWGAPGRWRRPHPASQHPWEGEALGEPHWSAAPVLEATGRPATRPEGVLGLRASSARTGEALEKRGRVGHGVRGAPTAWRAAGGGAWAWPRPGLCAAPHSYSTSSLSQVGALDPATVWGQAEGVGPGKTYPGGFWH